MLVNRFVNCQTLADVKEIIDNGTFSTLSAEEIETINTLFKCIMPDSGICIKNSFEYERVVELISKNIEEEDINMSMKSEVKTNIQLAVEEMLGKFEQTRRSFKFKADSTYEECVKQMDGELNTVKSAFCNVLDIVDRQLGMSALKYAIADVLESGKNLDTLSGIDAMAKTCREKLDEFISDCEEFGDPEEAKTLKELFGTLKEEDIFKKFFSTINWLGKKLSKKLKRWFKVENEKSVIGAIARSLAGIGTVLKAGIKILWTMCKFAASVVAASIIKLSDYIFKAIRTLVEKTKEFLSKKNDVVPKEELEDDCK